MNTAEIYYDYYPIQNSFHHIIAIKRSVVDEIRMVCANALAIDVNTLSCTWLLNIINQLVTPVGFILFQDKSIRLCVFDNKRLLYIDQVACSDLDTGIRRALQFYYQLEFQYRVKKLFLLDNLDTKKIKSSNIESPQFNPKIFSANNFDNRFWLAFASEIWGLPKMNQSSPLLETGIATAALFSTP
ncbi:hypothetical protein [Coxiella-like endosymbiont]|uniref:hypothetical protein n=1 Tax=Coxiella-like endosymbiont TaxID=1592897 RepID=UPI00272B2A58|nr:hypothetical protein [Coxiella-like endosymbiont]